MMIYGSKYDVNVKETCFGVIIDGEEDVIKSLVEEIRALDPFGDFHQEPRIPSGRVQALPGSASGTSNKAVALSFVVAVPGQVAI